MNSLRKITAGLLGVAPILIATQTFAGTIDAHWVNIGTSLSSIAQAEAGLADGSNTHVYTVESVIDFSQDGYNGNVTGYDSIPIGVDDNYWAVEFSGMIDIAVAGEYNFKAYTDDGFDLRIDGTSILSYNGNRSPSSSTSSAITLSAGLHSFDLIHWENGGVEAVELTWLTPQSNGYVLVDSFSSQNSAVPEPTTMLLFGAGLLGLAAAGRRK